MNVFAESDRIKKGLDVARQAELKRRKADSNETSKPKPHNRFNSNVARWKKKGVHCYDDFIKYINNPLNGEGKGIIKIWKNSIDKHKIMWDLYEEDQTLKVQKKRRCSRCLSIKDFSNFPLNNGEAKGYICLECDA